MLRRPPRSKRTDTLFPDPTLFRSLQHFGLRHPPLGKDGVELWDDGGLGHLGERFNWLLQSPGIGLLTGEPGVGKTARTEERSVGQECVSQCSSRRSTDHYNKK